MRGKQAMTGVDIASPMRQHAGRFTIETPCRETSQ
jgi:hypothetical protein